MFRDRTEPKLFRAGTVPETVPVRSLLKICKFLAHFGELTINIENYSLYKVSITILFSVRSMRTGLVFPGLISSLIGILRTLVKRSKQNSQP